MGILTLALMAAGGFFFLNSKKSSSKSTPKVYIPPSKEDRGYEIGPDCTGVIVQNLEKAKTWAFNQGKAASISLMKSGDNQKLYDMFYDGCDPDSFNKSIENILFTYDMSSKFIEGFASAHPAETLVSFFALSVLFLDTEIPGKTKPIDLPYFAKTIIPLRGYSTDGCKKFTITNSTLMYAFAKKLSKYLTEKDFDNLSWNTKFILLMAVIGDFCDNDDFDANLTETTSYMIFYNFVKAQVEGGKMDKPTANEYLASLFSESPKADKNVPKTV